MSSLFLLLVSVLVNDIRLPVIFKVLAVVLPGIMSEAKSTELAMKIPLSSVTVELIFIAPVVIMAMDLAGGLMLPVMVTSPITTRRKGDLLWILGESTVKLPVIILILFLINSPDSIIPLPLVSVIVTYCFLD